MRSLKSRFFSMTGMVALSAMAFTFTSCSRSHHHDDPSDNADAAPKDDVVHYSVNLAQIHMQLLGASAFSMTVDSCASGYTSAVTETASSIVVYKYDKGCLAKLNSLTVDGITYTPTSGDPFTTWREGDTAWFQDGAGSGKTLLLQVVHQLDNPIPSSAPTHGVEYAFSTIDMGTNKNCANDCIKNDYTVAVNGVAAPAFDIKAFNYIDMTPAGAGVFSFGFECSEDLVGTGTAATCKGVALSVLKYRMVQDTYNSVLNVEQAAAIIATDSFVVDAGEVVAPGADANMPHGGFVSKLLVGPNQMHLNPDMLMVVESMATSYKFWNVDVTPIFQP